MAENVTVSIASSRLAQTCALGGDVSRLRFATGARLEALHRMGVRTVRDLLLTLPRRYLDFTRVTTVAGANLGEEATVVGRVDRVELKRPRPKMSISEVFIQDDTGVMRASFFKQPWIAEQLKPQDLVALSGKVGFSYGFKEMRSPFHEVIAKAGETSGYARLLPVHPLSEGLSAAWMRRIVSSALADIADPCDFLPAGLAAAHGLDPLGRALRYAHFPRTLAGAEQARRRLAYDELLCLQLALRGRHDLEGGSRTGRPHVVEGPHLEALRASLPFSLTEEQAQAVNEILADMREPRPMNRLLLGDVGTGKTVVAACAMAACADTGTQCAVMAPTSVLANQYAEKVGPLLDAADISWRLITGSTPAKERAAFTEAIRGGDVTVVFGTSAILSADVEFCDLTLVVVDEQHRFGVDQRSRLAQKGSVADVLSMTATPIPRTLALSVYGDVEVSRITQRPVKGAGVNTKVVPPESLDLAFGAIREEIEAGHQAYVVCPLVEDKDDPAGVENPSGDERKLKSAVAAQRELSRSIFPARSVGLLHGRMSPAEKDAVMKRFRSGETDILVSTTVIEVGVDVPNATAMLVYDADCFGLATLHQLRGRVGRGSVSGRVFLETSAKRGTPARKRLTALEHTSDGFALAEMDLELRHEGDILGYRQSGLATLRLVDLAADADLVEAAHSDAQALLREDPALERPEHRPLAIEVRERHALYFEEGGGA